jgi:hypothetical protein
MKADLKSGGIGIYGTPASLVSLLLRRPAFLCRLFRFRGFAFLRRLHGFFVCFLFFESNFREAKGVGVNAAGGP